VFAACSSAAQKDTPALAAPFESAKQGVLFVAKRTTPSWNFATKKRENTAFLLANFQNANPLSRTPGINPLD
jgi:hypothetical protein